jgi:hypothetical protein
MSPTGTFLDAECPVCPYQKLVVALASCEDRNARDHLFDPSFSHSPTMFGTISDITITAVATTTNISLTP